MIANRQKVFVQAQLDAVEAAARAVLQEALQCRHMISRRIKPRQARICELRDPDQKGVPSHGVTDQPGGGAVRKRSAAFTSSGRLIFFGSNSKLNSPSLVLISTLVPAGWRDRTVCRAWETALSTAGAIESANPPSASTSAPFA